MKPNTLLLEGPEKTLYNTVPIGLTTWYVFLTNSPIFGTRQIGPSQKDGTIVRAQSETLGDNLLGSVSRDHGPIQGICGLQCPPFSTKTIPRNLPTPVVHHRNKRTPTVFPTIDLGSSQPTRDCQDDPSQNASGQPVAPFSRGPRLILSGIPQLTLPPLKLHYPMNLLDVDTCPFLETKMRPNPPVTKCLFLVEYPSNTKSKLFIYHRLFDRRTDTSIPKPIQSRTMQTQSQSYHLTGIASTQKPPTQGNRFVFFRRATSSSISNWRVNCPTLRSNRLTSRSFGSLRPCRDLQTLLPSF